MVYVAARRVYLRFYESQIRRTTRRVVGSSRSCQIPEGGIHDSTNEEDGASRVERAGQMQANRAYDGVQELASTIVLLVIVIPILH